MSYRITDVSFDPSRNDEFYAYADSLRDQLKAVNGLKFVHVIDVDEGQSCLLYTSPSPRDRQKSRMPSSA